VIGWIIAAYAIFGLMLRIDLWSLAVRIIHGPKGDNEYRLGSNNGPQQLARYGPVPQP
jgi:hypothetical protein